MNYRALDHGATRLKMRDAMKIYDLYHCQYHMLGSSCATMFYHGLGNLGSQPANVNYCVLLYPAMFMKPINTLGPPSFIVFWESWAVVGILNAHRKIQTSHNWSSRLYIWLTSIQLKLKVVVGVCNYVIFLANIFK